MSLNAAERAFTPTDEIIANPGCGWECSAGFYPVFKDLCNVGAIYERVTWASIEPEEGKFTWGPLEFAAQTAEKAGIPFYFRIMCVNSYSGGPYDTPEWSVDEAGRVQVRIEGRNDGVAPMILDYRLVYEARDAAGKALGRWVSSANPRGWLPGPFAVRDTLASSGPLPNDMRLFVWLESCGGRFRNFRFGVKECDDSGLLSL